jgi:hypothetical protein
VDVTVSGVRGEIRYGYHLAAIVGAWSIGTGRVLSAQLTTIKSRVHLAQTGLVFVLPRAHGGRSARLLADVQITGDRLTARITVPEPRTP